jgi:hypothetical protein
VAPSVGFQGKPSPGCDHVDWKAATYENKRLFFDMLTSLLFLNSQCFMIPSMVSELYFTKMEAFMHEQFFLTILLFLFCIMTCLLIPYCYDHFLLFFSELIGPKIGMQAIYSVCRCQIK